jgi:hypothetical protein
LTRPLFDTNGFVRNLERAFQAMWSDHEAGVKPKIIDIQKDKAAEPVV